MRITKLRFEILRCLEEKKSSILTYKQISKLLDMDIKTIEQELEELKRVDAVYMSDERQIIITQKGVNMLEPFKVKRAIFVAAGKGNRMLPLTHTVPKPLVEVNGVSMIETMIQAVYDIGIEEIIIIRGYLKEVFNDLLKKYPNIKFIDNDAYEEYNNIYSVYLARDLLCNAYVLEADLVLYDKKLIRKYEYVSNYLGMFKEKTDDFCFETGDENRINRLKKTGENCYHMYGISYWNEKDGKQLSLDIKDILETGNANDRYWDEVPLNLCNSYYDIYVRECNEGSIIEIDTMEELKEVDCRYANNF